MSDRNLVIKVNLLIAYAVIVTCVCCYSLLFSKNGNQEKIDELTIKRINIVDEKGDLRMVISNENRQHPGIINGEKLPERNRPAGIIFFNSSGDECGGLVYDGNEQEAGLVLSVDKFRDDQIMQLQYMENTEHKLRKYGLQIWDYPKEGTYSERNKQFNELKKLETPEEQQNAILKMKLDSLLMEERLFIGKNFSKEVGLFINDQQGNPRIKIYIDKENNPKIEFLDEKGNVIEK